MRFQIARSRARRCPRPGAVNARAREATQKQAQKDAQNANKSLTRQESLEDRSGGGVVAGRGPGLVGLAVAVLAALKAGVAQHVLDLGVGRADP